MVERTALQEMSDVIKCSAGFFAPNIWGSINCVLLQNGSVDGALSSRPPMPGRQAVRLDWAKRVSIAQNAARGLADLQKASIGSVAAPVSPSRILLHEPATPLLRPPDILELLSMPQVDTDVRCLSSKFSPRS